MTHARRDSARGLAALLAAAALALAAAVALAAPAHWDEDDWCKDYWYDRERTQVCEVRELTLARVPGILHVDPGENGGVEVAAGAAGTVRVKARVEAWAKTKAEAEALLPQVRLVEDGEGLSDEGPAQLRKPGAANWSVSFRIEAPASTPLELVATNGPVGVYGMNGRMLLETTNGPLAITGGGGDIAARTQNGPLSVELTGARWVGKGLDARAINGPVSITVPRGFSADVEYGTLNGPWSGPRPAASDGRGGGYAHAKLGKGGAPISVTTQNGPFAIQHAR
jgi:hypothetical protein